MTAISGDVIHRPAMMSAAIINTARLPKISAVLPPHSFVRYVASLSKAAKAADLIACGKQVERQKSI